MPSYASQVPIADRWAVAAYVRALQRSRDVAVSQLTADERARLDAPRGERRRPSRRRAPPRRPIRRPRSADERRRPPPLPIRARFAAPPALDRLRRVGWSSGWRPPSPAPLGAAADYAAFSRAWLVACIFWLGIALGCLALAMVHHMSGGAWGVVVRRVFEAAARTLPLLAAADAAAARPPRDPLLVGGTGGPGRCAADEPCASCSPTRRPISIPTGFVGRFAGYFALWLGPHPTARPAVGGPGPDRRPRPAAPDAGGLRAGAGDLGLHRHLRSPSTG